LLFNTIHEIDLIKISKQIYIKLFEASIRIDKRHIFGYICRIGIDQIQLLMFKKIIENFSGDFYTDPLQLAIYATDASVYRIYPKAVAIPKTVDDIKQLIKLAQNEQLSLIPRAAGTSLAGQVVGDGIVVDTSKYFDKIVDFNEAAQTVKVQPGVIRDELNTFLKPYGLFFGPITSTSNRCMIGGMVGNNSSGSTSIRYGVTRDKVVELKTVLSDGNEVFFGEISKEYFLNKTKEATLEGKIYKFLNDELSKEDVQLEIKREFPNPKIHRRNNGYAVDALLDSNVFGNSDKKINIAQLLCGSEGTLAFTTEITLKLDKLPPAYSVMVAAHFTSVNESLKAVVVAMKHNLFMCEMMDKTILDCTKSSRQHINNRFFLEGDPEVILMLEVCADTEDTAIILADAVIEDLKLEKLGYAFPKLFGEDVGKATELRSAGLGLLGNVIGDKKAVPCIEDTAVMVQDLPNYIEEFTAIMDKYKQSAVYYAHAGAGELHLRPILNLKKGKDVALFRKITHETALLVKKYGGSFSGEHGDGIVRAEFIPLLIGAKNYELLRQIKKVFDPNNLFNKGKIVDPLPMDKNLRYDLDRVEPEIETINDFSDSLGILRATEKCNGSGDCRKTDMAGGTMCPSYRATKNEKDTTRARANLLREYLTNSEKSNRFDHKELKEVFDLCLSCKACASECPSNVDVAALKSEFLYQYQKENGISLKTRLIANNTKLNTIGSLLPSLTNAVLKTNTAKKILGVAQERTLPKLGKTTLRRWVAKNKNRLNNNSSNLGKLYLFIDEFTNYYDTEVGIDTIELLTSLGYQVKIIRHGESGRSFISKGLLEEAKKISNSNVSIFKDLISPETALVGIEPSAILTFRDEYLRLADDKESAKKIAKNVLTIEEFFKNEILKENIKASSFSEEEKHVKIHGHCHQKSLSTMEASFVMLSLPKNYKVTIINSGCCGMAGSFGYEKEHYEISMQVGENSLFQKIRNVEKETIVAAAGTSCRHQIMDGTKRKSLHPITILRNAFKK
jgi:FAD/FMN-containing dehydrogenase/Fe-S oxidoreductase